MTHEPELNVAEAKATLEEALSVVQSIADPEARLQSLSCMLEGFAAVEPDRAIALSDELKDPSERESMIFEIAVTVATRDPERALTILRHYRTTALDDSEVERLVIAMAAQWPEKAVELLGGMESRFDLYRIIPDVAEAMALYHPEAALALARSVGEPSLRAEALRKIARGQFKQRSDFSRTIGDEVIKAAEEVDDIHDRAHIIAEMARELAPVHREWAKEATDLALTAAHETPPDGKRRDCALRVVAAAMAYTFPDRAEEIAYTIEDPGYRGRALVEIAQAVAATSPKWAQRLVEEACDHAKQVQEGSAAVILQDAARALAMVNPRTAMSFAVQALADGIADAYTVELAAEALARAHPEEVLKLAEQAQHAQVKEALISRYVYSAPGRKLARVLAVIDTLPERRDWLLHHVVSSLAIVNPARARELSRQITNPHSRILALCEAAGKMYEVKS